MAFRSCVPFTVLFLAVVVLSTLASACPQSPPVVPLPNPASLPGIAAVLAKVEAMLHNVTASTPIPGLVATMVYDQHVFWTKGFGLRNVSNPSLGPPTAQSFVRIASITKVFTGLMMMHMRDAGTVGLDDPVRKHLPQFSVLNPYPTSREVTLRELASHTSGLPRENPCQGCNESAVLAAVAQQYLLFPQYHRPHYSNLGVALLGRTLGHAAARAASRANDQQDYEKYLYANILRPLGMSKSTFDYAAIAEGMAVGVDNDGQPAPVVGWDGWEAPAGGLFSNAQEMAELIKLMFRNSGRQGGKQILDGSTINEVLKPIIQCRGGVSAFGLPWEFHYLRDAKPPAGRGHSNNVGAKAYTMGLDEWVKAKAGELPGYRSQIALIPELKLGIFISALRSETVPYDTTQSVWTLPILSLLVPAFKEALLAAQPPTPLPASPTLYTGSYGQGACKIFLQNTTASGRHSHDGATELRAVISGQNFLLSPFTTEQAAAEHIAHGSTTPQSSSSPSASTALGSHVLRATLLDVEACRWTDDGANRELLYFRVEPRAKHASSVFFMGSVLSVDN